MLYPVILSVLTFISFSGSIAMQQPAPSSAQPAPIDHFMNNLDRLIRQNRGDEIISMYEEHLERRSQVRKEIQQRKPLLVKAFDAIEQAEKKHQAAQDDRDAFDVLREQRQLPAPSAPSVSNERALLGQQPQYPKPSAPPLEQDIVRAPDAQYQDILIPSAAQRQPRGNAQSLEEQAGERFRLLTPAQKDEVLEDLVRRRDVVTLKALQKMLPGFKKIDEALELIEVMRKSAHANQQPQPAPKKLDGDQKPGQVPDSQNSVTATMRNVRDVVLQNPVESAVVATTVTALIAYAWRKSRSN